MPNLRPKLQGRDHRLGGSDPIPPGRWYYVGAADAPAFQNSWANAGAGNRQLRFRRTNENQVEIVGSITGGADGTVVFSLAGWWHPDEQEWLVGATDDSTVVVFRLEADGDVVFVGEVSGGTSVTAGDGLSDTAGTFAVNVDGLTLEISSDTLRVKDDGITAAKIAANAVGSSEIAADAVGSSELADNAVDTNAIAAGAVTSGKITGPLDAVARVGVRKNSTGSTFERRRVNLIEGGGVSLTVADDSGNEEVDVTISATAGGGTVVAGDTIWNAVGDLAVGSGSDSAAILSKGTDYDGLITDSSTSSDLRWVPGASVLLYDYEVSGSAKADIDTGVDTPAAGIAGTSAFPALRVLEIWFFARTTEAVTRSSALITFNNDTGANYDIEQFRALGTGVAGAGAVAQNSLSIEVPGSSATANYASSGRVSIPVYAGTVFYKTMEMLTGYNHGTAASNFASLYIGTWRNTAAITRLKVDAPGANNFAVGSRLIIIAR